MKCKTWVDGRIEGMFWYHTCDFGPDSWGNPHTALYRFPHNGYNAYMLCYLDAEENGIARELTGNLSHSVFLKVFELDREYRASQVYHIKEVGLPICIP